MVIQQLSVFVQNQSGRLVNVTQILSQAQINISALSLAETEQYGVLRMIVSDTEKAAKVLKDNDYTVKITEVICVITPDVPGELNRQLLALAAGGIDVTYMYGYSNDGKARLILKTQDPKRAEQILESLV